MGCFNRLGWAREDNAVLSLFFNYLERNHLTLAVINLYVSVCNSKTHLNWLKSPRAHPSPIYGPIKMIMKLEEYLNDTLISRYLVISDITFY